MTPDTFAVALSQEAVVAKLGVTGFNRPRDPRMSPGLVASGSR
jgi:hypothetical protein